MTPALLSQIAGAAQVAGPPTDSGGVPIGWVIGSLALVVTTLGSVVAYLYRECVKSQQDHRNDLVRQIEDKATVIAALKSREAELTQQLIDLHGTAGPDRAACVRALRAVGRLLARLQLETDDDEEYDE